MNLICLYYSSCISWLTSYLEILALIKTSYIISIFFLIWFVSWTYFLKVTISFYYSSYVIWIWFYRWLFYCYNLEIIVKVSFILTCIEDKYLFILSFVISISAFDNIKPSLFKASCYVYLRREVYSMTLVSIYLRRLSFV